MIKNYYELAEKNSVISRNCTVCDVDTSSLLLEDVIMTSMGFNCVKHKDDFFYCTICKRLLHKLLLNMEIAFIRFICTDKKDCLLHTNKEKLLGI
jgi:hypothetical protein